ncbi:MAG: hypothetical protein ABFD76_05025 [Smithella sp.]
MCRKKNKELFQGNKCRVCGCTDDDCSQCIERTGKPCYWVEDDLCSACVPKPKEPIDQKKYSIISIGRGRYFKRFGKSGRGRVLSTDNFLDAMRYPTDTEALFHAMNLIVEKIEKAKPRYGIRVLDVEAILFDELAPF